MVFQDTGFQRDKTRYFLSVQNRYGFILFTIGTLVCFPETKMFAFRTFLAAVAICQGCKSGDICHWNSFSARQVSSVFRGGQT